MPERKEGWGRRGEGYGMKREKEVADNCNLKMIAGERGIKKS